MLLREQLRSARRRDVCGQELHQRQVEHQLLQRVQQRGRHAQRQQQRRRRTMDRRFSHSVQHLREQQHGGRRTPLHQCQDGELHRHRQLRVGGRPHREQQRPRRLPRERSRVQHRALALHHPEQAGHQTPLQVVRLPRGGGDRCHQQLRCRRQRVYQLSEPLHQSGGMV